MSVPSLHLLSTGAPNAAILREGYLERATAVHRPISISTKELQRAAATITRRYTCISDWHTRSGRLPRLIDSLILFVSYKPSCTLNKSYIQTLRQQGWQQYWLYYLYPWKHLLEQQHNTEYHKLSLYIIQGCSLHQQPELSHEGLPHRPDQECFPRHHRNSTATTAAHQSPNDGTVALMSMLKPNPSQ